VLPVLLGAALLLKIGLYFFSALPFRL